MKSKELLKIIKAGGWYEVRQTGSHITLRHPVKTNIIIFPYHGSKEVGKGMENTLLKQAGLK